MKALHSILARLAWRKHTLISLLMLTSSMVGAAESTSPTFASMATLIPGKGANDARLSFVALPKASPVYYAGKVTAKNGNAIVDNNASWVQNQFNGSNGSFYIEFDSGIILDISLTDASTKSLIIPEALPTSVAIGDAYRIRRHQTLADLFGPNNDAGLKEGANSTEADNILVHLPETQQILTFFFSNYPGFRGWYRDDYTPASGMTLYPEQGLIIRRKDNSNLTIYTAGVSRKRSIRVPILTGFNLVGTMQPRKSMKLSELNLFTGDPNTGLVAASNPADADNLLVIREDAGTQTFFYSDYPGFEGWYDATYSPAKDYTIPPGSAFFLHRKSPRTLFLWAIPTD